MENGCARAHVQMQPTLNCVKLVSIGPLGPRSADAQPLGPRSADAQPLGPRSADAQPLGPPQLMLGPLGGCPREHVQMHSTADI